jgi:hypothetical protein
MKCGYGSKSGYRTSMRGGIGYGTGFARLNEEKRRSLYSAGGMRAYSSSSPRDMYSHRGSGASAYALPSPSYLQKSQAGNYALVPVSRGYSVAESYQTPSPMQSYHPVTHSYSRGGSSQYARVDFLSASRTVSQHGSAPQQSTVPSSIQSSMRVQITVDLNLYKAPIIR